MGSVLLKSRYFGAFAGMLVFIPILIAQSGTRDIRSILLEQSRLEPSELTALQNGEIIVKTLQTEDKQEIATLGIVQLAYIPGLTIDVFSNSLTQKGNTAITARGEFSSPPKIEDLDKLVLEEGDFEALKNCSVESCDFNMTAGMIRSVQTEIDWNQSDNRGRAVDLFRRLLKDHVVRYAEKGNLGLDDYVNRRKPVSVSTDHAALVDDSLFIREIVPELSEYLKKYPGEKPDGAEDHFYWSVTDFGLKPMITLTHASSYSRTENGAQVFLIANKQIYASRYLDSSLALAILVAPENESEQPGYLIFADRSRSDALSGALGGMARNVVEKDAIDRITTVLANVRYRLEEAKRLQTQPKQPTAFLDNLSDLVRNRVVLIFLFVLLAVSAVLFFRLRGQ